MKKKIVLLIISFIFPLSVYAYSDKVIPGGNTIGIKVNSKGVMIVGFYKVDGKYNKGNPELKTGDYIIKINNEDIETVDDLVKLVNKFKDSEEINVTYLRNKKTENTALKLIKIDGTNKTGLYVKDSLTGIGTLSYIDPETGVYGALGHEIIESSSKQMIDVKDGSIFKNIVVSIERSIDGNPGSKNAKFYNNEVYGNILKNTKYGIFGIPSQTLSQEAAISVKKLSEVNLGKAYIRTVVNGTTKKDYEINITDINKSSKLKSITFEITDQELLNKTGGIVQGMSGSPIVQDGYLVGAVTHVIVDDVKKGYGISIITMLDEGDKIINKIND